MSPCQLYHGVKELHTMSPLCTRPTPFIGLLLCWLTETTVRGYTCPSTGTYSSDSSPAGVCSFTIMLHA